MRKKMAQFGVVKKLEMYRNYARGMVIVLKLVFDVFTKVEFRITNFYFYLR